MKIAIFHGTMGSPDGNWFPWLKEMFLGRADVIIPRLPTPDGQHVRGWISATKEQVEGIKDVDVLIGHSCGASFLPHLLLNERLTPKHIFMISPFFKEIGLPDYDKLNASFFLNDGQINKICDYVKLKNIKVHVFHGDDDPYVPISQAQYLADKLDISLHTIQNGGHLNTEFGFTKFPELYHALQGIQ